MDWNNARKVRVTYADMKADSEGGAVSEMVVESSRQAMPRRLMQALAELVGAPFVMGVETDAVPLMRSVIGDPGMMQDRPFSTLVPALGDAVDRHVRVTLSSASGRRSVRLIGLDEMPYALPEAQEDRCMELPAPPCADGAPAERSVQALRGCF